MEFFVENIDRIAFAEVLGYSLAGPLAVGIANWLHEECKKRDISILYLCGRDSRLIQNFFTNYLVPADLKVVYLETSRMAMKESGGSKYREYFNRVSRFEPRSAIFDISWMGSSLEFHKTNFPDRIWVGFTLRSINKSENINFFVSEGSFLGRKSIKIYKMRDFLELLLTDSSQRTISYSHGFPIFDSKSTESRSEVVRSIHAGALRYMNEFNLTEDKSSNNSFEILKLIMQVWDKPSKELKNLLSNLIVEEDSDAKRPRRFTVNKWSQFRFSKPVVMPHASFARGALPIVLKTQQNVFYSFALMRFVRKRLAKINILSKINLYFRLRSNTTKNCK